MDSGEGPSSVSQPEGTGATKIKLGDTILLRIPSGDIRTLKLEKDSTINLGKFGSFFSNELIDQPYGLAYDITDKKLTVLPPKGLQEVEDTDATNELINDGQAVQPLTVEEIEALKKSGLSASEIIEKQIEQHANFQLKTEYSKEKYKKRKEAKYSKSFSTVIPTLFNVCEYWFNKDPSRLRDIRPDTLSQMLNLASIRPGGRYLAVDDASGVVVAGILDRLGGKGRLITICDVDSPPAYPVVTHMNFSKEFTTPVMSSLNWATADEDYTPVLPSSEPTSGSYKSDAQKTRLNKRKIASNALFQTRDELFNGEFDGLIVASQYDPFSIVQKLFPYLAGSASIVVHSPQVHVLSDLHGKLRDIPGYLGPAITEAFLRRYQVLPGRTHPMMNASGSGGFILHVIKIYDDPNASSVMAHRHKVKKLRAENTSNTGTPTPVQSKTATPSPTVIEDATMTEAEPMKDHSTNATS
ncbi:Gcd10p-domain-containing protein [Cristinia sonorae]|uniref:tRNA (adenine(58)-N(1))-methyltransferase non-catalytic subunit TRM6 n=1 Tax=Cristinia sonorae TaxID=1940300 RepID=A0A8K0USF9_9AGAR|nr:Gcd10p-domain-containing protein [Cristinia sonorae]